jgi:Bpu10I restriction endonuclease
MFQECAGTAARLKQGCPIAKYYALVEYLDMQPEDTRLTEIDNVFLLRKTKRLPFEKRNILSEIKAQHKNFPISSDVISMFVAEIQNFIDASWYDPEEALRRGSFL